MKPVFFAVILSILGPLAHANESSAHEAFERIKSLSGSWEGRFNNGRSFTATFEVVSNGNAVLERSEEMITIYHLDGDSILLTHYCMAGNQPRMRALPGQNGFLQFDFLDISNLKPESGYMNSFLLTFVDENHIVETWNWRAPNSKNETETLSFVRKEY